MHLRISLADFDFDELRSLWTWLSDEPRVRRFGDLRWSDPTDEAQMGGSFETISLSITTGLSVAQLVVALAAWRESRAPRKITVVIEHRDARAVLDGSDETHLDQAAEALEAAGDIAKAAVRPES